MTMIDYILISAFVIVSLLIIAIAYKNNWY